MSPASCGRFPQIAVEIVHVTTSGDRDQTGRLSSFGGVGVFTREVQKAVLEGQADVASQSEDLPTESAAGLDSGGCPEREDTADALVLPGPGIASPLRCCFPRGALGQEPPPRQAQLLLSRVPIADVRRPRQCRNALKEARRRRLRRPDPGGCRPETAGARRRVRWSWSPPVMYPAVGQGAPWKIECRADDTETRRLRAQIDHVATQQRVTAERHYWRAFAPVPPWPVGAATRSKLRVGARRSGLQSRRKRTGIRHRRGSPSNAACSGNEVADNLCDKRRPPIGS